MYYKRLLVTILVDQGEDTRDEREVINETCLDMLDQLQRVDPTRKARYQDLGELPNSTISRFEELKTESYTREFQLCISCRVKDD